MRVLLLAPRNERGVSLVFPLGIAYISSALRKAGHEVMSLNLALYNDDVQEVMHAITAFQPSLVGIGGMTFSFSQIKRILSAVKARHPEIITLLGGGVLTSAAVPVFKAIDPDFGIIGEGDETAPELVRCIENGDDPSKVSGIVFRGSDGGLVFTPPRPVLASLDDLPLPDYEGLGFANLMGQGIILEILGSRGCPHACTFCYSPLGRKYRQRSLDHLFQEIEHVAAQYGVERLGVADELFAATPERVREFCRRITPLGIKWHTQLRVDSVDEATLREMGEAGCCMISYGLESMDERVLKSMNKKIKPAQIARTLELTYSSGITSFGNFIFGDIAETQETADNTLNWWLDNRKHLINLGSLQCWPGSKVYGHALEKGVISDEIDFISRSCPEINITAMTDEQYWKLLMRKTLYDRALLFLAKVTRAELNADGTWSIDCICPHCGAEQSHLSVGEHNIPFNRHSVRLLCRCRRQFDLPIQIPKPDIPRDLSDEADRLHQLATDGDTEALAGLEAICDAHRDFESPRYRAAMLFWNRGDTDKAYKYCLKALLANPVSPPCHELMAHILDRQGETKAASAFREQAKLLLECMPPEGEASWQGQRGVNEESGHPFSG